MIGWRKSHDDIGAMWLAGIEILFVTAIVFPRHIKCLVFGDVYVVTLDGFYKICSILGDMWSSVEYVQDDDDDVICIIFVQ